MRYVKFRMESDKEGRTNTVGIICNIHQNWNMYLPTLPEGLGHDLLDHAANERGHLWQEIAALGATTWRTDFGCALHLVRPWCDIVASDIVNSFRDNNELRPAPKVKINDELLEQINDLLKAVRPFAVDYYESELMYSRDDEDYNAILDDTVWEQICGWFRFGFARSMKRFDESYEVQYMVGVFTSELKKVWGDLLQFADSGHEFTLAYDVNAGHAEVRGFPRWWME